MNDINYEIVQKINPIDEDNCIIEYREIDTKDYDTGLHWHNAIEIIHVIQGCIKYTVNGKIYLASDDEVFLINSSDIHSTSNVTDKCTLKALVMVIPDSFIMDVIPSFQKSYFKIIQNSPPTATLRNTLKRICKLCTASTSEYDHILISLDSRPLITMLGPAHSMPHRFHFA